MQRPLHLPAGRPASGAELLIVPGVLDMSSTGLLIN